MGIKIALNTLKARKYCGSSLKEHSLLVDQVRGKVIAIDASQWLFQAQQGARARAIQADSINETDAWVKSAGTLVCDRVTQILRYGAHPVVVFDGVPPSEKQETLQRRGVSCYAHSYNSIWSDAVQKIMTMCSDMGVHCIKAVGEGEATCATLSAEGLADLVWTLDIVDALLFGAQRVMRDVQQGTLKAQVLVPRDPQSSQFQVVDMETVAAEVFGVPGPHARDALTLLAAMVGTDYNDDGLKGFGEGKALGVVMAMLKHWRAAAREEDFMAWALDLLGQPSSLQEELKDYVPSKATLATFVKNLQACWMGDGSMAGRPFHEDAAKVVDVFQREARRARASIRHLTREDLCWTGSDLDHVALMASLAAVGVKTIEETSSSSRPAFIKLAHLEAERMTRLGEAHAGSLLMQVTKVTKATHFTDKAGKGQGGEQAACAETEDDSQGSAQTHSYYHLVDVSVNHSALADIPDPRGALRGFGTHLQTKAAKDRLIRLVRTQALQDMWPTVYRQHEDQLTAAAARKAGQKDRKAASASKSARKKSLAPGQQLLSAHCRLEHGGSPAALPSAGRDTSAATPTATLASTASQPDRQGGAEALLPPPTRVRRRLFAGEDRSVEEQPCASQAADSQATKTEPPVSQPRGKANAASTRRISSFFSPASTAPVSNAHVSINLTESPTAESSGAIDLISPSPGEPGHPGAAHSPAPQSSATGASVRAPRATSGSAACVLDFSAADASGDQQPVERAGFPHAAVGVTNDAPGAHVTSQWSPAKRLGDLALTSPAKAQCK